MASPYPCTGSSLLVSLFDDAEDRRLELVEVARTRLSVHYETDDPTVPGISVCTPEAVRLPNAIVTTRLPSAPAAIEHRALRTADASWRVERWWRPHRPRGLRPPQRSSTTTVTAPDPARLIGAGPGLTPAGDDIVAGALVAAHATGDPRLPSWQRSVRGQLTDRRTTAVSRAMLACAVDGYATDALAEFVSATCVTPADAERRDRATAALLALGHTSGAAMRSGVLRTLATAPRREAA